MIWNPETARDIAQALVQIKAIKLQPQQAFTWASGWQSPIYCDNRISLSHPTLRRRLSLALSQLIREKFPQAQAIAGVATGAIAMSALVAQELELPLVYVRPEPKKHGRQNQIEGALPEGAATVVIEDLISTGGSSLKAVEALREAQAEVLGMAALFTYAFAISEQNFQSAQCDLYTLSDYPSLLAALEASGELSAGERNTLENWRRDPAQWQPES